MHSKKPKHYKSQGSSKTAKISARLFDVPHQLILKNCQKLQRHDLNLKFCPTKSSSKTRNGSQ